LGDWLVILLEDIVVIDDGLEVNAFAFYLNLFLLPILIFGRYFSQDVIVGREMTPIIRVKLFIAKPCMLAV
jgi:hypothetical protein